MSDTSPKLIKSSHPKSYFEHLMLSKGTRLAGIDVLKLCNSFRPEYVLIRKTLSSKLVFQRKVMSSIKPKTSRNKVK
jgi:hypothetical protein